MKKFIKTLLIFCLPLLFLFVGLVYLSPKIINHYADFRIDKKDTLLILGHSQPECDLNDTIITHSKNLAQGGEAYVFTYQKIKKIIAQNPQITTVLLSFSNNQTQELMNKWSFGDDTMGNYFPKYSFMMEPDDKLLFLKNNFNSFLSSETKAVASNFSILFEKDKNRLKNNYWGGYLYLIRNKTDSLLKTNYLKDLQKNKSMAISRVNMDYLTKIVSFCKSKNIQLYLMRMPMHKALFAIENESLFQSIRTSKFNDLPFLDFHAYPASNTEFGDFDHLNHVGAKRFSIFFNALLSKGLLKSPDPNGLIHSEMQSMGGPSTLKSTR